mgnify:CR=1 FL=1
MFSGLIAFATKVFARWRATGLQPPALELQKWPKQGSQRHHKCMGRPLRFRWRWLRLWSIGLLVNLLIVVSQSVSVAATEPLDQSARWLNNGERLQFAQFLFEDEPISATCSQDCYSIAMSLKDRQTQAVVAQTEEQGKHQSLQAPYEGEFILNVTMQNCARDGGCRTWLMFEENPCPHYPIPSAVRSITDAAKGISSIRCCSKPERWAKASIRIRSRTDDWPRSWHHSFHRCPLQPPLDSRAVRASRSFGHC